MELERVELLEREPLAFALPCPGKSFQENAEVCLQRAEKNERTNVRLTSLIKEAEAELTRWRAISASLACQSRGQEPPSEEVVCAVHKELCTAGIIKLQTPPAPKPADGGLRRKYGKGIDCFRSPTGYEVIVGRTAGTNERVSFELTPRDAFWFHSDCGVPGSHVAILCPAAEVATLEDVEFAAKLAAWHSKARGQATAAVCYCYGAQVTRPRIPKLGQVRITGRRGCVHVAPAPPPD